ncbi:MAG: hypothetical protein LBF89_12525 [Bacteroidales bacterium]|jgi:hypothetical protein|nr:hypothetical protein [Bacteroidales bacterium]
MKSKYKAIFALEKIFENHPRYKLEKIAIRANEQGNEEQLVTALSVRKTKLNEKFEWG